MDLVIFKNLPETKQRAVVLKAQGQTWAKIAQEVQVSERTVARWLGPDGLLLEALDEYKLFLADQVTKKEIDLQERRKAEANEAWNTLLDLALGKVKCPPSVQLEAINSCLDRAGISRISKHENKVESRLTVTDEDRCKRFERLRELQADLAPKQLLQLAGKEVN